MYIEYYNTSINNSNCIKDIDDKDYIKGFKRSCRHYHVNLVKLFLDTMINFDENKHILIKITCKYQLPDIIRLLLKRFNIQHDIIEHYITNNYINKNANIRLTEFNKLINV
jgi:hypothetical protein